MLKTVKYINSPIFPVYLGICDNAEAWHKHMRYLRISPSPEFSGTSGQCTTFESKGQLIVIISVDSEKLKDKPMFIKYEILAHEASHAADFIFEYVGEKHPGAETKAYVQQWIIREFGMILKWE